MSCLLLRLEGPLQSWGYRSRFSDRDTGLEPTKSGIVGLLCCALGRSRSESPADLAALAMHVRVDREGALLKDFHTAGGGTFRDELGYYAPRSSGDTPPQYNVLKTDGLRPVYNPKKGTKWNPVLTERHYLQDASFLVALEGDKGLLETLAMALRDPAWPLALGRRSCPPTASVLAGLRDLDGVEALKSEPLIIHPAHAKRTWNENEGRFEYARDPQRIRLVIECPPGATNGEMRRDVPVSWPSSLERNYTVRYVREELVSITPVIATPEGQEVAAS